jgi:pimeloyl-ACP methyl ester carboxylesterase
MQMQAELAALSDNAEHSVAPGTGHYIHLDDPAAVSNAVVAMIGRCRARTAAE